MLITLGQAIRNTIVAEQAAEQFYLRLAAAAGDEKTRQLLTGIAAQERKHAEALDELGIRLVEGKLPERADLHVNVIESAPAAAAAADLGMRQALEIAVEAENSATLYYDAMAATTTGEASKFFEHMRQEEEGHAAAIRKLLGELA